jgi:FkbM family methyltransferase
MNLKTVRFSLSAAIKERVMRHYQIPFSCTGLDPGIVNFLPKNAPINLVDIGASSGEFARAVESYCGIRNALLVEPQPARIAELVTHFPSEKIIIRECAMSDKDGFAEMDVLNWHYSSSLLRVKRDIAGVDKILNLEVCERIKVRVQKLDNVMAEVPWRAEVVDLVKLDVQGSEFAVLLGAQDTLQRTRMVWTEVAFRPMYEGAASFSDIHSFMYQLGFVLLWILQGFRGDGSELLEGDALFARGTGV